jgi:hypothetical protein
MTCLHRLESLQLPAFCFGDQPRALHCTRKTALNSPSLQWQQQLMVKAPTGAVLTSLMRLLTADTAWFLSTSPFQPITAALSSLLCSCSSLQLALNALTPPRSSSSGVCSSRPDHAARMTCILCTCSRQFTAGEYRQPTNNLSFQMLPSTLCRPHADPQSG